jgi:micrococcal nuclease
MSEKPSAAWYLAPIFLGIIGSAIMWYVLKDETHPDSPKMIKKGWVIGIVLTLLPLLMLIPMLLLIPMTAMNDFDEMQDHMGVIPDPTVRMVPAPVPAPTAEDVPEMIAESENCDESYPDVCIASYPPDLDCGEIRYANFRVVGSDPHGFDRDNDGIGCES